MLKEIRMAGPEDKVYYGKTINELLDAWHKTEIKRYKKKIKSDSIKRTGKHIPRID